MFQPWEQGVKMGGGVLSEHPDPNSFASKYIPKGLLDFLKTPEAMGLAAGLLEASQPSFDKSPSFGGGLSQGLKNMLEIRQKQQKEGMQGKFGKALADYNAILNAYGPDHELTKLAKQNLENISAGSQGLSFEFDPVTGAYTLGMGGSGGKGSKGGPMVSGESEDLAIRTAPTPAITTDVQKQIIAKKRAEIVNPHLEHPYVGSGSNAELANDILKYRQNPTPELREKLVKLATAEKLVSYSANLNLLAEGGSTGESATRRQENSVRQGWAEGIPLALKNMPKDIVEEGKKRADEIKSQVSKVSEKEYAGGFAIDVPNKKTEQKESDNKKSSNAKKNAGKVAMIKNGKKYLIPDDMVEEALADGFKRE